MNYILLIGTFLSVSLAQETEISREDGDSSSTKEIDDDGSQKPVSQSGETENTAKAEHVQESTESETKSENTNTDTTPESDLYTDTPNGNPVFKSDDSANESDSDTDKPNTYSTFDSDDSASNESDDLEFENAKGNIVGIYLVNTAWDQWNSSSGGIEMSGDPQYAFAINDRWDFTLGIKYKSIRGNTLATEFRGDFIRFDEPHNGFLSIADTIGITTGIQFRSIRLNTAASWVNFLYFEQEELNRTPTEITYTYSEIPLFQGVIWDNTLSIVPEAIPWSTQLTWGLPIHTKNTQTAATFPNWYAQTLLQYHIGQFGYEYTNLKDQSIHQIRLGIGLLL